MRTISADLLSRIQSSQQTIYGNANPELKIVVSRGLSKELFHVYTMGADANLGYVDVAARRLDTAEEPDLVYGIRIVDGTAYVVSHPLPYDPSIAWTPVFTVGPAEDVAIEFDGSWTRDFTSRRFNLVTEELPWIFYVNGGTLYAQEWDGEPLSLASSVSKIRAVRGWFPTDGDYMNDQGTFLLYLKTDGTVWYRNYCLQSDGTHLWETERQITFSTTAADIALFRTNDFRIGVVIETTAGNIEWVVSDRNWAGMSVFPELLTASIALEDISITVSQVQYLEGFHPIERIAVEAIEPRVTNLYNGTDLYILGAENIVNVENRTYEPVEPKFGDGVTTVFTMYWTPSDNPVVYVDGASKAEGVDYTRVGRVITFFVPPANGAEITVSYTLENWGVKVRITLSRGVTVYDVSDFVVTDDAAYAFTVGAIEPGELLWWQSNPDYPPAELILTLEDFNVSTGNLNIAYTAATGGLVGELGQAIATDMAASFAPTGLQTPGITAPVVEVIANA